MIGVEVDASDREVAREFFELCKTPWEFIRPNARYDVLLCTVEPREEITARLVLLYSGTPMGFDTRHAATPVRRDWLIAKYRRDSFPIYRSATSFPSSRLPLVRDANTSQPLLEAHDVGDGRCVIRIGYGLFDETRLLLESGQPPEHARTPTLELHIQLLRELVTRAGLPFIEIPPVPDGHDLVACLTHDIDHPLLRRHWLDRTMCGFLYRATVRSLATTLTGDMSWSDFIHNCGAAAKVPLVRLQLADDPWCTFARYSQVEGIRRSTYFAIPFGNTPGQRAPRTRACGYELADIDEHLKPLELAGDEIALHGLDAWVDANEGRRERAQLTNRTRSTSTGVRMHWLYFDHDSPARLEEAGFSYDSTFGYNDTVGFRPGTAQVYRPLGTRRLLELPLSIMDTALFFPDRLGLDNGEARRIVSDVVATVRRFGGACTVNWHDRSIAPERLWGIFYEWLLDLLDRAGAWFATATQATAWFEMRRRAAVTATTRDNGAIEIAGTMMADSDRLPGLRIRIHPPCPHTSLNGFADDVSAKFIDLPFKTSLRASFIP